MTNPKLKGIVDRFATNKKIEGEFWEKYQIFANYVILKNIYNDINDNYPYESELDVDFLDCINFGKNNTMAIDGCFFIYKKEILHLGFDDDELVEKFKTFGDNFLHIVLIQTKTGNLETTDLSTLSDCFNGEFFQQNEWKKFIDFRQKCNLLIQTNEKINLKFYCFYVIGNELDRSLLTNPTFTVRETALKESIKKYFWIRKDENIIIDYLDDNKMLDSWDEQEYNSSIVTKCVNYVELTREIEISNVGKILFGAITFGELMKIIYDNERQIRYELYGYNVRDEIEKSDVKSAIINTIKSDGDKFILLNNGITAIVDKQEIRGRNGIYLENIRIVNGCQTCNAILETCKNDNQYNDLQVNLKIIETSKNDVLSGSITFSSNYQNKVTKENLISLHPKMFELEKAFKEFDLINKSNFESCLFERREGQYKGSNEKFIDMLALAKAYISLFDQIPNETLMYREEILEKFILKRENDTYFTTKALIAGILWFNIYRKVPSLYENARYHIYTVICTNELIKFVTNINSINTSSILDSLKLDLDLEIQRVIKAIKESNDNSGEQSFPPTKRGGKIHYRKFYPATAFEIINCKYKEIKNVSDTTTNN